MVPSTGHGLDIALVSSLTLCEPNAAGAARFGLFACGDQAASFGDEAGGQFPRQAAPKAAQDAVALQFASPRPQGSPSLCAAGEGIVANSLPSQPFRAAEPACSPVASAVLAFAPSHANSPRRLKHSSVEWLPYCP